MHTGKGQVLELSLEDGRRYARLACPPNLIPSPGQYLLAGDDSTTPLPVPLFYTDSAPESVTAGPVPESWDPGMELSLRGPLGRGFSLPFSARKVALVAFDNSPARLRSLVRPALNQAAVVLVSDHSLENLPDEVEVQPLSALPEIIAWADYLAFDVKRENLNQLREGAGKGTPFAVGIKAQVLIHTPVPCGGIAECGICSVTLKSGWKLACKDGPVFDWWEI